MQVRDSRTRRTGIALSAIWEESLLGATFRTSACAVEGYKTLRYCNNVQICVFISKVKTDFGKCLFSKQRLCLQVDKADLFVLA